MYLIKEERHVSLLGQKDIEKYEDERKDFEDVKNYIQSWIEGWIDTANESHLGMEAKIASDWKSATVEMSDGGVMKLWIEEKK